MPIVMSHYQQHIIRLLHNHLVGGLEPVADTSSTVIAAPQNAKAVDHAAGTSSLAADIVISKCRVWSTSGQDIFQVRSALNVVRRSFKLIFL